MSFGVVRRYTETFAMESPFFRRPCIFQMMRFSGSDESFMGGRRVLDR